MAVPEPESATGVVEHSCSLLPGMMQCTSLTQFQKRGERILYLTEAYSIGTPLRPILTMSVCLSSNDAAFCSESTSMLSSSLRGAVFIPAHVSFTQGKSTSDIDICMWHFNSVPMNVTVRITSVLAPVQ
jgi:hypothetical protein